MKISATDGSISIVRGTLRPGEIRADFLASEIGRSSREALVNQEWRNYEVKLEPGINATVFFRDDRLYQLFFMMPMPSDAKREWTVDNELARKDMHDAWLREELGEPPYTYAWGRVISDYDARGCVSEILVIYDA